MSHEALVVELTVGDIDQWRVEQIDTEERLSEVYEIDLEVVYLGTATDLEGESLGQSAELLMRVGESRRVFHGIVASATARGRVDNNLRHTCYHLHIVPRAWLLGLRTQTRLFEEMRVDEVVEAVLAPYHIPTRFVTERTYPTRAYCTQYEETDLAFVQRITAEEGIFFFFEQPLAALGEALGEALGNIARGLQTVVDALPVELGRFTHQLSSAREVMVFADDALWYPPMTRTEDELRSQLERLGRRFASEGVRRMSGEAGRVVSQLHHLTESDSPELLLRDAGGALRGTTDDSIYGLEHTRSLRPVAATYRQADPRRPHSTMTSETTRSADDAISRGMAAARGAFDALTKGDPSAALSDALPQLDAVATAGVDALRNTLSNERLMERYEHHTRHQFPDWKHDEHEPERMLEADRRRHDIASGRSACPWLTPGHRFRLHGHPLVHLDREWVPVVVRHRFHHHGAEQPFVYENTFECVPSDVAFRPQRPKRRFVQTCLTGIVIGGEEIHTDAHGRIRVRFHWDRRAVASAASTCWLRIMQPWAGTGWGTQMIPRLGHEVVVGFEDGNPDKPLVMGSVYNGVNRFPFSLPEERAISGIRTSSTPGGRGYNELSFDDTAEREKVHLRAERDLDVLVRHDRSATIERNDRAVVHHDREVEVRGDRRQRLHQLDDVQVGGDQRVRVKGTRHVTVVGETHQRHEDGRHVCVEGKDQLEIRGSGQVLARGDTVCRHGGNFSQLVGSSESKKNHSVHVEGDARWSASDSVDLRADEDVVLACGRSFLRITPDKIVISSPEILLSGEEAHTRWVDGDVRVVARSRFQAVAKKVLLRSSGAAIGLSSEAHIDGGRILINSPQQAEDTVSPSSDEATIFELVDQQGNPVANQPFRILLDDGSEQSGMLDDEGRAELFLDVGGAVVFTGITNVERS